MVVLGVDPGLRIAGYAIMSVAGRRYRIMSYGALTFSSKSSVAHRVGQFYEQVHMLIQAWDVEVVSIETPFLGKNAQNFLKLGYVRGTIFLLAYQHGIALHEFTPRQVKRSVTGFGGAQKGQVARVVRWLCPGIAEDTYEDVTDALAIAICGCLYYV